MRACDECSHLSYVQKLRKRFEQLSKENDREFHSSCNWWLDAEDEQHDTLIEPLVCDEPDHDHEDEHHEDTATATVEYQQQMSVGSQRSSRSYKSLHSQKSSDDSEPQRPQLLHPPQITLDTVDDDEVFESADDIEEEIEAQYIRHSETKATLSRPGSITSQTST
jgi:hypothetical protein